MSLLVRCRAYAWKTALVLSVGGGGLWTATHGVAGTTWRDVAETLRSVEQWRLAMLAAIWIGGLAVYSLVLSAALPGLGLRRGLLLNLSGSAVANTVPLGGAVATALNWRMARTWGHSDRSFLAFCILTNVLDVASKLLLPVAAVATLLALSVDVPPVLWWLAAACSAVLVLALVARGALGRRQSTATGSGRRWYRQAGVLLHDSLARIGALFTRHWPRLLPASACYVTAQVLLLYFALRSVGLDPPVSVVLTVAAIERLATLVPLTPGGTGVAEVGAVASMVAFGMDPVQTVAGVLLYRVFLVVMEIPVGGVLLAGWTWLHRDSFRRPLGDATA